MEYTVSMDPERSHHIAPTDFPNLAFDKLASSYTIVKTVHDQFRGRIAEIAPKLDGQERLIAQAQARCDALKPRLAELAEAISAVISVVNDARGFVASGEESLKVSVVRVRDAVERVRALDAEMRVIVEIAGRVAERMGEIADIAVENKLIAINASITASRAGDKVRGFKVIAAEVTRLSVLMAEKVDAIVARSSRTAERVSLMTRQMRDGVDSTANAVRSIDEAFGILSDILETMEGAGRSAREMLEEAGTLAAGVEHLRSSLSDVAESGSGAARVAEESARLIASQQSELEGIGSDMPELGHRARDLAARARELGGEGQEPGDDETTLVMSELPIGQYDPALATLVREYHYAIFTCLRLIRYSSDKKLVPYFAESWTLVDGERTWDFTLKKGVKFPDGTEVTSADVKFSLERVLKPDLKSPYANFLTVIEGADEFRAGRAAEVRGIAPTGPYAVRIVLKSATNFFLGLLAHSFCSIVKKDPAWFGAPLTRSAVVSAGPYRSLPESTDAVQVLEANPGFVNGSPFFRRLVIRRDVKDIAAAAAAGEMRIAYNIPAALERDIRHAGFRGETRRYVSRYCAGICVNFLKDNPVTRNAELRRALVMALDRDGIVGRAFGGDAVRADTVIVKELLDTGERGFVEFNPDRAKETIAASGVSGMTFTLAFVKSPAYVGADKVVRDVAEDFARAGVKVSIVELPPEKAKVEEYRKYDLVLLRFMPEPDLYAGLEPFINPEGGDNYFHYDNPAIFDELKASISIRNENDRKERFKTIIEHFTLDVFMIPLYFQKTICLIARGVKSVYLSLEESFLPDAAYPDVLSASFEAVRRDQAGKALVAEYASRTNAMRARVARVDESAASLNGSLGAMIHGVLGQGRKLAEIDAAIRDFEERSARLKGKSVAVSAEVRKSAEEARGSADAARMILDGLDRLQRELSATAASLDLVTKDIAEMVSISESIAKSNDVIGSVAVNAAIISSKGGAAKADLLKVSKAIAELARRNDEYGTATKSILAEMYELARADSGGLAKSIAVMAEAIGEVGSSGAMLARVAPTLGDVEGRTNRIAALTDELAGLLGETARAVSDRSGASSYVMSSAETMKYGIELERAVVEVLRDVVELNKQFGVEVSGEQASIR